MVYTKKKKKKSETGEHESLFLGLRTAPGVEIQNGKVIEVKEHGRDMAVYNSSFLSKIAVMTASYSPLFTIEKTDF